MIFLHWVLETSGPQENGGKSLQRGMLGPASVWCKSSCFSFFPLLNVPHLPFSLWVLAHGLSGLLSGAVMPQRSGRPLLALLWPFLIRGGLWNLGIYPSMGERMWHGQGGQSRPERGRSGWRSLPTLYFQPQSSSASHCQHPVTLTSGWVGIRLSPHMAHHHCVAPSQEPRRGPNFRLEMVSTIKPG